METLEPPEAGAPSSPSQVPKLVYESLARVLGRERAEVVDFYIDSRLASIDPDRYERALGDLLGRTNGSLVIRAVKSELAKTRHARGALDESFSGEVRALERALVRSVLE